MENKEDRRIYTLSQEAPARAVVKMSVPLIFGMFIMVLYNLVDTYFIGLTGNDYQLAAVNLAYPVMMVTVAISNIIGTGASSYIARCLGANEKDKAAHTLTVAFTLTFINSIIVMGLGLGSLPALVRLLGAKDNTFIFTKQYVQVILTGSFFTMGSYTTGALLRSEGSVRYSMTGMIVGTIMNIILDPLFIFTLNMQIRGAAVATILSNAAGFGVSVLYYVRRKTLLRPSVNMLLPTKEILSEIYWVGIPASLETLLTSAAYTVNNNLAVNYSELTVTAMGIAQKVLSLGNYVYQGFASGTQPIMGYNYGAEKYDRMLRCLFLAIGCATAILLVGWGLSMLFPRQIARIFTTDATLLDLSARGIKLDMLVFFVVGSQAVITNFFQCIGKVKISIFLSLSRQLFLLLPMAYFFPFVWDLDGVWYSMPASDFGSFAMTIPMLLWYMKRFKRK